MKTARSAGWLDTNVYDDVGDYGYIQWFVALCRRQSAIFMDQNVFRYCFDEKLRLDYYRNQVFAPMPQQLSDEDPCLEEIVKLQSTPIDEITCTEDLPVFAPNPEDYVRLLSIDLKAPSGLTTQQFEKWLAEQLKQFPPPVKKPGPTALNDRIEEAQLAKWRNRHILEISDLMFWWDDFASDEKPSNVELHIGKLFLQKGYNDELRNWGKHSIKVMRGAFDSLDMLAREVLHNERSKRLNY